MNDVRLTVDGRTVTARPGQTLAAAMMADGVTIFRTTRRNGTPRGMFCGIGVCFECSVTVNGRSGIQACLEPVRSGDVVSTERSQ